MGGVVGLNGRRRLVSKNIAIVLIIADNDLDQK